MADSSADVPDTLSFSTELQFPDTYPQAAMYALFDSDPRDSFRSNLAKHGQEQPLASADAATRSGQLMAAWDRMFDSVPGSHMYVAVPQDVPRFLNDPVTGKQTVQFTVSRISITSDSPLPSEQTKWVVSRAHSHRGRPLAWCILVKLNKLERPRIVLNAENAMTLESIAGASPS